MTHSAAAGTPSRVRRCSTTLLWQAAVCVIFLSGVPAVATGTTYYVDALRGDDSQSGLRPDPQTEGGPWKTLGRVEDAQLSPGDAVVLRCGRSWDETLVISESGTPGAPITFGSYGDCESGPPTIDGGIPISGWSAVGDGVFVASAAFLKTALNLIENGEFDSSIARWGIWSKDATATSQFSPNCRSGGGCLYFQPSDAVPTSLIHTPYGFGLRGGVTYEVSFWARADETDVPLRVIPRETVEFTNLASPSSHTLSPAWKKFAYRFTPGVGHPNARIDFEMPAQKNLYLDGVSLLMVTPELDGVRQVFLDDTYQSLAHYPNRGFDPGKPTNMFLGIAGSCSGGPTTSLVGGSDLALTPAQASDLAGAIIHIRSNGWSIEDRVVTAFDPAAKRFTWSTNTNYDVCPNWGYYLDGKLWMLDTVGEWYYDAPAQKLYVKPGSGVPENRVIASNREFGIFADGRSDIVIEGIKTRRTKTGVTARNSNRVLVRNVEVYDSEGSAIDISNSREARIVGSKIVSTVRNGIEGNYARDAHIVDNEIVDTGTIGVPRKSVAAIRILCHECGTSVGNAAIEGNTILRSGYLGIFVPNQASVRGNYITDSCTVLDDCSAIYTSGREFKTAGIRNNGVIDRNIVINVWGNANGRPDNFVSAAQGIYLDDFSNSVMVTGNTVVNADHGVQIHNGAENSLSDNTIYGSRSAAIWMQEDRMGAPGDIHDNEFRRNGYVQINGSPSYRLQSSYDGADFARYQSNRYSTIHSEIVAAESYVTASGVTQNSYTFPTWVAGKSEDQASAFSDFRLAQSRVLAALAPNVIANSTLDTNAMGWAPWSAKLDASVTHQPCSIGGCLKFISGTSSSLLSSPKFTIEKNKYYRVSVQLKGDKGNEPVTALVRLNGTAVGGGVSWANLGPLVKISLSDRWQNYVFWFRANDSSPAAGARLDIETPTSTASSRPSFYLDNATLDEVSVAYNDPAEATRILVNPSTNDSNVYCDQAVDPKRCSEFRNFDDGSVVDWPVIVPGSGSKIIVWDANPFRDSDGDGIVDQDDRCPSTSPATPVNAQGCSFDQER